MQEQVLTAQKQLYGFHRKHRRQEFDGCLVVTPYYNKATQKGLIQHYTAVAKSVDLPIIMYNVPGRTGCNIQPETAAKLAKDVDNIVCY